MNARGIRRVSAVLLTGLSVLSAATSASAAWTRTGTGDGTAKSGSTAQASGLSAGTTACGAAGKMNIPLSWATVSSATGYTITFTASGTGVASGTATSTTSPKTISVTSTKKNSSYSITVAANYGSNWTGADSAAVVVASLNC